MQYNVIDSDGHICEPGDLWERYIDPKYRYRAPKVAVDPADGLQRLQIEDRFIAQKGVRVIGSLGLNVDESFRYEDGQPGGFDPHARIEVLDQDGIDAAFLFPSLGLLTGGITDPDLACAVCRAYNRWLVDYCAPYPERLFGVAMLPMQSIEGSVQELRYAREELGFRAAFLRPNPYNDRLLSNPDYDALWAVAQDLDVAMCIHEGTGGGGAPATGGDKVPDFSAHHIVSHTLEMMLASLNIIWGGVCERFPTLRFGFMESGGGWMASWLDRMDRHYDNVGLFDPESHLTLHPSEYFKRQCWISFEPVEETLPVMIDLLGANKILWATDFPHGDGFFPGAPKMIAEKIPESLRRSVLAEGAIEFYKLPWQ